MKAALLLLLTLASRAAAAAEPEISALPRLPGLSPTEALAAFRAAPGWTVSLAAAEPQVVDPVAMSFDDKGALHVAEMRDYSERRNEKLSRVRKLTDEDGDGVFETSTVFVEGLAWVTGVLWHEGAVYVAATPDIWRLRDRDGDGVAEEKEVVITGFGAGRGKLNVQALVNSLTLGPDSRIHGASAANGGLIGRPGTAADGRMSVNGRDFSFDPDTLDLRTTPGGGQYGLTFDRFGRRFVCSNSHHIQWAPNVRNGGYLPAVATLWDIAPDGPAAPVFRLSPDEPWRVTRTNWRASGLVAGIIEGNGKPSGYFTSASGIHIWRDCAIVADCGSNLAHRKQFRETPDGPVAERPPGELDREFLASTDTWFRPVSFATAPDGSLLIADMCREYIEHPDSLPPPLKRLMDLNSGNDRGRIWRVRPTAPGIAPEPAKPNGLMTEVLTTSAEKAPALWSKWWAATADRPRSPLADVILAGLRDAGEARAFYDQCSAGLSEAQAISLTARLKLPASAGLRETVRRLATKRGAVDVAREEAMELLAVDDPTAVKAIALDPADSPAAREAALRLVPDAAAEVLAQGGDTPSTLRRAAVERLGATPAGPAVLLQKVRAKTLSAGDIPQTLAAAWRRDAALGAEARALLPEPPRDRAEVIAKRQAALTLTGSSEAGTKVFTERCALCHRDEETGAAVGPDRAAFRNKGKPLLYAAILDPNAEVAPQFARVMVTQHDGTVLTGIAGEENADSLTLLLPGGGKVVILRKDVAAVDRAAESLMPPGVEEGLSDQDLADLLEWLVR